MKVRGGRNKTDIILTSSLNTPLIPLYCPSEAVDKLREGRGGEREELGNREGNRSKGSDHQNQLL